MIQDKPGVNDEPSRDEIFLNKIREYVLANLNCEKFSTDRLAGELGYSRSQVHRKLKKITGKSLSQFVREIRLEEAVRLLRARVGTVSEISFRVGFSSPAYFNKSFSAYYGITPGEVLKEGQVEINPANNLGRYRSLTNFFRSTTIRLAIIAAILAIETIIIFKVRLHNNNPESTKDYIIHKYDLSDIISIIMFVGLPAILIFNWFLRGEYKEKNIRNFKNFIDKIFSRISKTSGKRFWISISIIGVAIIFIITSVRFIYISKMEKWAVDEALPMMQNYIHDWDYLSAFQMRQAVIKYIPDNSDFVRIDAAITKKYNIISDPQGASVSFKPYNDPEGEWNFIGTTPIYNIELPTRTMFRWKVEKPGYEVVSAVSTADDDTLSRTLHLLGTIPDNMVYVEGIKNHDTGNSLSKENRGFFIDKYEVTNRQFKEFIDAGGYQNPKYWKIPFIINNDTLSFADAMKFFKDATERPGPATWEAGDYREGRGEYPVNGISWYEADAYSIFTGKSLPTTAHWRSAAGVDDTTYNYLIGSNIIPLSNMGGQSVTPVGSNQGLGSYGTLDMAGNVREWCWNKSSEGHIIQGGAWDDAYYMSTYVSQMPSFDRSEKNGFRCVIYPDKSRIPENYFNPFEIKEGRDFRSEVPASDVEFLIFKNQFKYDKTALNSHIEVPDETFPDCYIERISFDAAYENKRVIAYLFLPKNAVPPYQTMIYFPGQLALSFGSIFEHNSSNKNIYFLLKNGRAVIYPVYSGTYERRNEGCGRDLIYESHQNTECLIKWVKDFSRTIDYLETRDDIDISRIGYIGDSWGGRLGSIFASVEERISLSVLIRPGFRSTSTYPEADEFNYAPHVTTPVLMLAGRYDLIFPLESNIQPMYDHLGTPDEDKKLVLFDTDHFVPKTGLIVETLDWLDRYFGPAKK